MDVYATQRPSGENDAFVGSHECTSPNDTTFLSDIVRIDKTKIRPKWGMEISTTAAISMVGTTRTYLSSGAAVPAQSWRRASTGSRPAARLAGQ